MPPPSDTGIRGGKNQSGSEIRAKQLAEPRMRTASWVGLASVGGAPSLHRPLGKPRNPSEPHFLHLSGGGGGAAPPCQVGVRMGSAHPCVEATAAQEGLGHSLCVPAV